MIPLSSSRGNALVTIKPNVKYNIVERYIQYKFTLESIVLFTRLPQLNCFTWCIYSV